MFTNSTVWYASRNTSGNRCPLNVFNPSRFKTDRTVETILCGHNLYAMLPSIASDGIYEASYFSVTKN
jgi:hypothetical protein